MLYIIHLNIKALNEARCLRQSRTRFARNVIRKYSSSRRSHFNRHTMCCGIKMMFNISFTFFLLQHPALTRNKLLPVFQKLCEPSISENIVLASNHLRKISKRLRIPASKAFTASLTKKGKFTPRKTSNGVLEDSDVDADAFFS